MRKASPAEDLSAKKALARTVIDRLKQEYPDAGCTLDYDHAWQLLVSVRLAAQCTDARVNIVVQDLFAKYPDVASLAAAEPEDIEAIVKPCGLGRSKARDISACMRMLRDRYDCKVPTTFEELLALPEGVRLCYMAALGYPTHESHLVEMQDGSVKYYLDADRNYCVPKRGMDEVLLKTL